jgi:hypothetical protein
MINTHIHPIQISPMLQIHLISQSTTLLLFTINLIVALEWRPFISWTRILPVFMIDIIIPSEWRHLIFRPRILLLIINIMGRIVSVPNHFTNAALISRAGLPPPRIFD